MNITESTKLKILELQEALLEKHPRMPTLLEEIHATLLQYPECVTLLTAEDLKTIVNGLEAQTGVHLVQTMMKRAKSTKSVKIDADEL